MAEGKGEGNSRIQWKVSKESAGVQWKREVRRLTPAEIAARNLRYRTNWVNAHQDEMVGLVRPAAFWHRGGQRQEYLTSNRRTCVFASTANGARDLGLPVPTDFEQRAVRDPRLVPHFQAGGGDYALITGAGDAGVAPYVRFAQEQIPGLQVMVPQNPVTLESIIQRLNLRLPTIVFINEGRHAIELNGVRVDDTKLVFGVIDPLVGRFQSLSLQDLVNRGLTLNAGDGTLRGTVGLSKTPRPR